MDQVVKSISIANLLNQRDAVIERLEQAMNLIREAGTIASAAGVGIPHFKINENRHEIYNAITEDPAKTSHAIRQTVDRGAWQHLMNESGLRTFMDAKARDEWNRSIEKGEFPDLTEPNVVATFERLHASRGDLFERGVLECFRHLSWHYKTNRPFAFGKRIVLRSIRYSVTGGGASLGSINYRCTNEVDDLLRVLSVMDGKPEPDHRGGVALLLSRQRTTADPPVENDYLSIRSFRNGNAHLTFKRPDLVAMMNKILRKHYPDALAHDHHAA